VSPSNQALSAGTAAAAAQIARTRRTVTSLPGCQAWMSASSTRVVGTTLLCASAMTRAMFRRTPRSCSGWPLALTEGGRVRIGRPLAESAVRCAALRVLPPRPSPAGGEGAAGDWRKSAAPFPARGGGLGWWPAAAAPSAAAHFTSAIVTTPPAPHPVTPPRSTRRLRASARRRHRPDAADREQAVALHRVGGLHRADHGAAVGALAAGVRFAFRRRHARILDRTALAGGDHAVVRRGILRAYALAGRARPVV